MLLYATSKNTGPTWTGPDAVHLLYLGSSLEDAEKAVGDFSKYEREYDRGEEFRDIYSALPRGMNWSMAKYYMADGWWYTIVSFEIDSENEDAQKPGYEINPIALILDAEAQGAGRA